MNPHTGTPSRDTMYYCCTVLCSTALCGFCSVQYYTELYFTVFVQKCRSIVASEAKLPFFCFFCRLLFELIWRDYFRFLSMKCGNTLFKIGEGKAGFTTWLHACTTGWRENLSSCLVAFLVSLLC